MDNMKRFAMLCSIATLLTACGGGGGHSGGGPTFPPSGSTVTVNDPFAEVTSMGGGNLLLYKGWLTFSLFDGNELVEGATFEFEQRDGAGGGSGLYKTVTIGSEDTSLLFAPYESLATGLPGACGYTRSQLFDELPGTEETVWTVTITVPPSWYSDNGFQTPPAGQEWSRSYTFSFDPGELEARGPKFHRTLGGQPEQGIFWHVWDRDLGDKIVGVNAIAHFYVANDSGDPLADWLGDTPQPHENIVGQFGTPWYGSILVDQLTGDFLMSPDPNHSTIVVVGDELGRFSAPVLVRVGDECQPLMNYISRSQPETWYDVNVSNPADTQLFYLADAPTGYSYSNMTCVLINVDTGWMDFVPVNQGVATWNPPLPNIGQEWIYEVYMEGLVTGPPGSPCAGGMLKKGERYRLRLIGQ